MEHENVRCKCCGSSDGSPFMEVNSRYPGVTFERYACVWCAQCGLIYVSPDPPACDLSMIYGNEDYLDLLFENTRWRQWVVPSHWLPVLKAIEEKIDKGRILDVGCSDGLFLDTAEKRGWDVYGADVNGPNLEQVRKRYGEKVQCASIYELIWPQGSFDAIRLCHVLEHLSEPRRAMMKLNALLREGGVLNIGVPVFDPPLSTLMRKLPMTSLVRKILALMAWIDPPHHVTTWSTVSLQRLCNECGFEIVWRSYRSDVFPWIYGFRRLYIFFRLLGIPLKVCGSGATIEIVAQKIRNCGSAYSGGIRPPC